MKKLRLLFLIPAIAAVSCSEESIEDYEVFENNVNQTLISSEEIMMEIANPGQPGAVSDIYFAGQKLPVETFEGNYLYQGDMLFSPSMVSTQPVDLVYEKGEIPAGQKSVGRTSGRWPDNTVYYAIDGNLSNQQRVIDAVKHWESTTSLKFVERTTEGNYIYFTTGSGCASYVGMIGGKQNITLSSGCSTGNTIHEIGHAIGLWHEQSRVDRDKYITINYENLVSGTEHNFKTYEEIGFDGDEYTSNLDFSSIMMYSSYSFSKNGLPTITKTDGSTFSVQRKELSSGDLQGISNMYPSSEGQPEPEEVKEVYENGNYYTVEGLRVYRYNYKWFYYTYRYGFKEVRLSSSGYWYYA